MSHGDVNSVRECCGTGTSGLSLRNSNVFWIISVSIPLILGWEEWVALPGLGLPAIKAKVDTGARTSALHAGLIELFGPAAAPRVRFVVHPVPGREDIEITCSAPVIERRDVTSSNGERENRYVIATTVVIGGREWPIEVTLTNRETMSYRMLLGRQAIREDMIVEPASSFRQPRLSYRPYRNLPRRDPVRRPLRIGVVTRRPDAASSVRLAEAASHLGHVLELIDPRAVQVTFDCGRPGLTIDGAPLAHYDGVIPRLNGATEMGPAMIRQLEMMGSFALNSGDALERLQHPVSVIQALVRAGVGSPPEVLSLSRALGQELSRGELIAVRAAPERAYRLLVVDHKVIDAVEMRRGRLRPLGKRLPVGVRRAARRASRALGLGLASFDVVANAGSSAVIAVSAAPSLLRFEKLTSTDVARPIIVAVEAHVRSWSRRSGDGPTAESHDEN